PWTWSAFLRMGDHRARVDVTISDGANAEAEALSRVEELLDLSDLVVDGARGQMHTSSDRTQRRTDHQQAQDTMSEWVR
ncbi:MAG: hypothetical protein ACRDVZ_14505, partial [Jiangellaceae bacterium]